MNAQRRLALLNVAFIAVLALVIAGCGHPWVVVKQASPSPMTASSRFVLERPTLDPGFHVGNKTEAEWMSTKKPETQDSWDGDKAAMAEKFVEAFMSEKDNLVVQNVRGDGVFAVRARYINYEPGYYAVVASAPGKLAADIELVDPAGHVLDVIRIDVQSGGMSAGQSARSCASQIGTIAAKYVKTRVGM